MPLLLEEDTGSLISEVNSQSLMDDDEELEAEEEVTDYDENLITSPQHTTNLVNSKPQATSTPEEPNKSIKMLTSRPRSASMSVTGDSGIFGLPLGNVKGTVLSPIPSNGSLSSTGGHHYMYRNSGNGSGSIGPMCGNLSPSSRLTLTDPGTSSNSLLFRGSPNHYQLYR